MWCGVVSRRVVSCSAIYYCLVQLDLAHDLADLLQLHRRGPPQAPLQRLEIGAGAPVTGLVQRHELVEPRHRLRLLRRDVSMSRSSSSSISISASISFSFSWSISISCFFWRPPKHRPAQVEAILEEVRLNLCEESLFCAVHNDACIHEFIRSIVRSFIHGFIHSIINSFIHSFIHSSISFIHSFHFYYYCYYYYSYY